MPQPDRYVSAKIECSSGHLHEVCIEIARQVPLELRCEPSAPSGYSTGGGGGCRIPSPVDLVELAGRELRDNFQDSKRRGYVLIRGS
jgi:hypothetical protein